jgi:hypothetical protein
MILPAVCMGVTWSLILTAEHKLKIFEEGMLRRIFRPKREKVMGGCRKLSNEVLHKLHTSQNITRMIKSWRMRWTGQEAHVGKEEVYIERFDAKARRKETTRETYA